MHLSIHNRHIRTILLRVDDSGGIKQGSGLYWVIGLESLKIVPATLEGHSAAMVCIEMTPFTEQEVYYRAPRVWYHWNIVSMVICPQLIIDDNYNATSGILKI